MPLSYRLIMLDTSLLIKKSLNILIQNGMDPCYPLKETALLTVGSDCISAAMGLQDVCFCRFTHNV